MLPVLSGGGGLYARSRACLQEIECRLMAEERTLALSAITLQIEGPQKLLLFQT